MARSPTGSHRTGSTFRRGCLELDPRVINGGDETRGVDRSWCLGFVWFGLIADLNRSVMLGSLYVLWVVRCWFVNRYLIKSSKQLVSLVVMAVLVVAANLAYSAVGIREIDNNPGGVSDGSDDHQ
ncbi:hypothetical protein Tsubulata_040096, partial [Turnera subulata]